MYEDQAMPAQHYPQLPKLSDIRISFLDNGFVVGVVGHNLNKNYVVQAESNKPEEIENALDVIRSVYYKLMEEG